MSPRVLIVDDHPAIRAGLRSDLSASGVEIVGEAGSGEEALHLMRELSPDVTILDVELPDFSGIEVIRRMKLAGLTTRVLMLSVHRTPATIRAAIKAGASGYLAKDSSTREIAEGIRKILAGEQFFGKSALAEIQKEFCRPRRQRREDCRLLLTECECAILQDLTADLKLKDIATRRSIRPSTVKTHIRNAKKKTGIATLAGLVRFAVEQGLIGRR